MPGLTVSEKQHWKDRIAARIARRVEAIKAEHPALFDRVRREAHGQALGSLGLSGPYAELEAVQAEEAALARRKKKRSGPCSRRSRASRSTRSPTRSASATGPNCHYRVEAAEAVGKRQAAHQERLLADDPVGREVAGLEAERDGLLDTIWLATSPAEVRSPVVEGQRPSGRRADGPGARGDAGRAGPGRLTPGPPTVVVDFLSRPITPTRRRPPPVRARNKLNVAYFNGCLLVAALFGLTARHWGVFWAALAVTVGLRRLHRRDPAGRREALTGAVPSVSRALRGRGAGGMTDFDRAGVRLLVGLFLTG